MQLILPSSHIPQSCRRRQINTNCSPCFCQAGRLRLVNLQAYKHGKHCKQGFVPWVWCGLTEVMEVAAAVMAQLLMTLQQAPHGLVEVMGVMVAVKVAMAVAVADATVPAKQSHSTQLQTPPNQHKLLSLLSLRQASTGMSFCKHTTTKTMSIKQGLFPCQIDIS
jgi:hypothetical protein